MGRHKIAFTGAFDIANYGDLLFPVIFERAMNRKRLRLELLLFSPNRGSKALDQATTVHALMDFEELLLSRSLDCIVVGGGALIHFNRLFQIIPGSDQYGEYRISETWVVPSLLSLKHGVGLSWNVPGVPFRFDEASRPFVRALCGPVDYLSVRDATSRDNLAACLPQGSTVRVIPDTILSSCKYIDQGYLARVRSLVLNTPGKYVVFHCNRHIREEEIPTVVQTLTNLRARGFEIVLLPLAYTHGDEKILARVNEASGNSLLFAAGRLDVFQMMSILAGCDLYIGTSFHGMITALSYGKKAIGYNYPRYEKSYQLFELLNSRRYCIDSAEGLEATVEEILANDSEIDIGQALDDIDEHFDTLVSVIADGSHRARQPATPSFMSAMCEGLSLLSEAHSQMDYLHSQLSWHEKDNKDLRERLNRQFDVTSGLEHQLTLRDQEIEDLWTRLEDLSSRLS